MQKTEVQTHRDKGLFGKGLSLGIGRKLCGGKRRKYWLLNDHFGPRHCANGANSSPMAHENMTYGPNWPVKVLDGAKFYLDCAKIKNVIFQFSIKACCEQLSRVNICTRIVLS